MLVWDCTHQVFGDLDLCIIIKVAVVVVVIYGGYVMMCVD